MKKHTICSNIDLNIEDWRDDYKEYLEMNEMDDADPNDEDAIYEWMNETNDMYFDDEYANLNKKIDGRILVIADLGLWNGRKSAYKILGKNMKEIFNINSCGFDYAEFYGDGYNIKATEHHHDGTNYYLYRVIREDRNINNLLNAIYNGEKITNSQLNYYTKSLYKDVANVYGWR
jgi:hypothetical protein